MQGGTTTVTTINDHSDFITVKKALSILGFSEEEAGVRREGEEEERESGRERGRGREGGRERETDPPHLTP